MQTLSPLAFVTLVALQASAQETVPTSFADLSKEFARTRALVQQFCLGCHSTAKQEGELDLERFSSLAQVRKGTVVWLKVAEMLDTNEMPPKDAPRQPTAEQKRQLRDWITRYLDAEARANAGDPGPVVLRRLNNAEYTYTIHDLTGVELFPAKEFPGDSAAGEGFTNTGNALVMSPALLTKYFDAGKQIARHAVLLPDGFRFSPSQNRSDWTNDTLARIRDFYRQFADAGGGTTVNLQGIVFDTNTGGRLAIEKYLAATLAERDAIRAGNKTIADVARSRGLNAKYLQTLWTTLNNNEPSILLGSIREQWQRMGNDDVAPLAAEITRWQQALWRFTSVGHIGKVGGPKGWQEPVLPVVARHDVKVTLTPAPDQKEIMLYLVTSDAGDGNEHDYVVWDRPRFVAPGRPALALRDVRAVSRDLIAYREKLFASTSRCLAAAAEAALVSEKLELAPLAARHGVEPAALAAWLDYLGIGTGTPAKIDSLLTRTITNTSGYEFVRGWIGDNALSVVANSSDQHVRIPGNMKPHGVAVHPSPALQVAIGWRSPVSEALRVEAKVQHAHPECGNGVAWTLEVRRGNVRQTLASGLAHGANVVPVGPVGNVRVKVGDLVSLVIGPRDGNHSCDLTAVDLTISAKDRTWDLAKDVSPDILAGNPHADGLGNADVWHFYTEPVSRDTGTVVPADSLLAKWQSAEDAAVKEQLAGGVQKLLLTGPPAAKKHPDSLLYRQASSLGGPLLRAARNALTTKSRPSAPEPEEPAFGVATALFGKHPDGSAIDASSLCVQAPAAIEIRLPADLVEGCEFVAAGRLHAETGMEGSVQLQAVTTKPQRTTGLLPTPLTETSASGPWTSTGRGISHAAPVLVSEGSAARRRVERAFDDFRSLFPIALCYTKIVPVDEVVTLTQFYREDDQLKRLMLDDAQAARLDRLWEELHFISHDALTQVDALAQLIEYATQDADPKVFEPLRKPFADRAAAFRQSLEAAEPKQIDALITFAARAYRRPLADEEARELRGLYRKLREQDLPHDEAFRFTLARTFVSPAFLYRIEQAPPGAGSAPVSDWELATRLSYFLWSSTPDQELRDVAAAGKLRAPDVLVGQAKRMLKDARVRRLATEFACQWLHIYEFDALDEKSEKHFPEFASLRGDMYQESIRFFTNAFQQDASVLDFFDSDHTFVNDRLAKHYGIGNVAGADWRRVDGLRQQGRGGLLGMAATLAKQSGASRTSPILRGNWVSEVLLGEKLPKPPKGVPQLPEDETSTDGLTVRQLVERHTSDAKCATCHQRIDPFGFALEGFDAIGRRRDRDLANRPIETTARVQDGTQFDGLAGLRRYLLETRRDAILRQFCKKLLGYSLGRGVQLSDEPLLTDMQAKLRDNGYRFSVAVETILRSRQFREIRGMDSVLANE